jgi:hypothetical protein
MRSVALWGRWRDDGIDEGQFVDGLRANILEMDLMDTGINALDSIILVSCQLTIALLDIIIVFSLRI